MARNARTAQAQRNARQERTSAHTQRNPRIRHGESHPATTDASSMGLLFTLAVVGLLLTAVVLVGLAVAGDKLLTWALRFFAGAYVGPKIRVVWSLRNGVFALMDLKLSAQALPALEPLAGLPSDLEAVELELLEVTVPLYDRFLGKPRKAPLRSSVVVGGLRLALSWNAAEKWVSEREENLERFMAETGPAQAARLANANAWTAAIAAKLKELHAFREKVRNDKASGNTSRKKKHQPSAAAKKTTATAPAWMALVDKIIDSFAITVDKFVLTIRDDFTARGIGITFEKMEISAASPADSKTKRDLVMTEFSLFVNTTPGSTRPCYLVEPMGLTIVIRMPPFYRCIWTQTLPIERSLELAISMPNDVVVAMRPAQINLLLALLRPLYNYWNWKSHAAVIDELMCVEMGEERQKEYMELYQAQQAFNELGWIQQRYQMYQQKDVIENRTKRLEELERNVLASRLVQLRARALGWDVPLLGEPLPFVPKDVLERNKLRRFRTTPLDMYEPAMPDPVPMFQRFKLTVELTNTQLQLRDDADNRVLSLFTAGFSFKFTYMLSKIADDAKAKLLDLTLVRFGILDDRNVSTNVFNRLIDRRIATNHMMNLHLFQLMNGHVDLKLDLTDFAFLVVFDPLMAALRVLMPAFDEDEATQMRFLSLDMSKPPESPEKREATTPVVDTALPPEYSPLLLWGMSLCTKITIQNVNLCLIGDSAKLNSHVLALTSDVSMKLISSERHEALELELSEVALQPCSVEVHEQGINLELSGRTILELEGEGVDLELGYRLVVGDPKTASGSKKTEASRQDKKNGGLTASSLWGIARKAALKKEIVEVEHPQVQKAEESMIGSGRRDRLKPGARRRLMLNMSDFGVNLSTNDLGVFIGIATSLDEASREDADVVKERLARDERIAKARKNLEEQRYRERLKLEFTRRDIDGGGSLDAGEVEGLLASVGNCGHLTRKEFQETVEEFIKIVDRDGSGDISLEEFEAALTRDTVVYERLHKKVVILTGQEYVNPRRTRKDVPHDHGDLANVVALRSFWKKYQEQTGASITSLEGQSPMIVQKKMVRAFGSYEYAQEAWVRLVNPALVRPGEQSPWLLTKEMEMGGRGNVIDELLSSFDSEMHPHALVSHNEGRMFIHTIISTSFGGFYIRLMDDMLPMGLPALEISAEELAFCASYAMWEGDIGGAPGDPRVKKRTKNNYGLATMSFEVYGKYYNTKARQIEPFLEYYQGVLELKKEPDSHLDVIYSSDRYLQLNLTSAFMEVINTTSAAFSKVQRKSEKERKHIKEEDGLFWMINESGVNLKYYVVARKHTNTSEQDRVETVSEVVSVPPSGSHPCTLLNVDDELRDYEQQSLKEKQLRKAFKNADVDGSGELDTTEVRAVLREVFEEEEKQRRSSSTVNSSIFRRSASALVSETEMDRAVEDFIALADTDMSGQVSWEEFKIAIAKSRATAERYISLEIEGYEPVHGITLASIGQTQVYELSPRFEEVENEKSIATLYRKGVLLLNKDAKPSQRDLQKAYACLRRVRNLDPKYEWIDSYYEECVRQYLPVLVAVHISVDGYSGLQVKISSAELIRNDTAKATECLLLDGAGEVSPHNPVQNDDGERFFVLPPRGSISIPLDLVDVGSFAIRQIGETEWSNQLALSVHEQRLYKNLTRYEQKEARKMQMGDSNGRVSDVLSKVGFDKMGKDVLLPEPPTSSQPGQELLYPSMHVIDDQPTVVVEKASVNDPSLGQWFLVIQPQLVLHNVLPCGVEYALVQTKDCPADVLDSKGEFRIVGGKNASKTSRTVKALGTTDYFQFVNEVNSRRLYVGSGKSVHIFGLDLDKPALMKMRLCASEANRAGRWSDVFQVALNQRREVFDQERFDVNFVDGPSVVFQQQWQPNCARSIFLYAPYWIQNKCGLDLRFKLPKGYMCTTEQHRGYFNGERDMPMLVNAPLHKAMVSVRPYQETPRPFDTDALADPKVRKYVPSFDKLDWSEATDMTAVGTVGELRSDHSDRSFVLAFSILAGPEQFFRTKILKITPRYILVNRVPRPLQVTPLTFGKKMKPSNVPDRMAKLNCTLKQDDALVVYNFIGSDKLHMGFRLRDVYTDSYQPDVGAWSPGIPIGAGEEFNIWTRGALGEGPVCKISTQSTQETMYTTITDISTTPRYRIENRCSSRTFAYMQLGNKTMDKVLLRPCESHSFVWDDPLAESLRLSIQPFNPSSNNKSNSIPNHVDLMQIGIVNLVPPEIRGEVYIDGSTRVFALGDTDTYNLVRQQSLLNDWLTDTLVDVALHGIGITMVDASPREILNLTIENFRIESKPKSRALVITVHHFQIDDMTPHSTYPVIMAPIDSGFNSDQREGWLPEDGERPFLTLTIDTSPLPGITVVNDFDLDIHSMKFDMNLEYWLQLINLIFEWLWPNKTDESAVQAGIDALTLLLSQDVTIPESAEPNDILMYFKHWSMSSFEFHLVFDSLQEEQGEGITMLLGSTLGSIIGGIAHVTPEFQFNELVYENRFFYQFDLLWVVIYDIVYSVVGQWYKIVGSVELLGDPVGLATEVVDGFALAGRQIKRSFKGKSQRKGEVALTLAQTIVGAPLKSLAKVSNGLGDVLKKATDFENQEDPEEPRHVPEGLLQGGIVFTKSIAHGVAGLVKEPVRGAKRDGVKGFAKGVGRGTLQLVASPFVGTLGVVEKVSQSVNNTTHLLDDRSAESRTRRPARDLSGNALKPLQDSNVITEVEVYVAGVEGLPDKTNTKVVVRVYTQEEGGPARDIAQYKSSTVRHNSNPRFDQSWLISVTSLNTFIEIDVYHKRKPLPKKLLGYLRYSMEDIYRDFNSVPARVISDSKAKAKLKRRKRVRGSVLKELANLSSTYPVEVRDDSWRQKVGKRSLVASAISDDLEDMAEEEDDFEQDLMTMSQRSVKVGSFDLEEKPVILPLQGCDCGATIQLTVRLPYIYTASEIQEMRFWRATARESNKIVDPIKRAKNQTSRLINQQLSKLSSITRQAAMNFPALKRLHPFEREVVLLTVGKNTYEENIQQLRKVYAALHNTGREYERECQDMRTKQEAIDCGLRCVDVLKEVVDEHSAILKRAADMAKSLRGLPSVGLEKPIFAFVGAPNVGKSSLVRALSTASPEVANYPFTTRGITMGHIFVEGISYQIADTPGLIYRPDEKRNAIEKLALAMMEKTKASIGFVFDPTGLSGTSIEDQLNLRNELRERVSEVRSDFAWLDIISKIDQPDVDVVELTGRLDEAEEVFAVSAQTNQGLVELGEGIRQALEGIAAYKYKAGTYTYLDNKLNHFWTWAVELLPIWMAPNLVTLSGTVFMSFTTIIQLLYSPHLDEPCPTWVYVMAGLSLFLYQTLDALDGKQARRTNSSSPLGQLFDHGCDAFSTISNIFGALSTVQLGRGMLSYTVLSSISISFYMAQWEEYHTGVMSCGNGYFGVTEGQLTLIAIHLITAVFGHGIWKIVPVPFLGLTLAHYLVMTLVASNVFLVVGNIMHVLSSDRPQIPADELGNKHVAKHLALMQLIPVGVLLVLGQLFISGPDAEDYAAHPIIILYSLGIGYCFFSTRMIVSHMCKVPFTPQLRVLIPFGAVVFNSYAPVLGLLSGPIIRPLLATAMYVVFINFVYFHYVVHVVNDICSYLNIYCFKIGKKAPPAAK
ncbi:TPA: hypothetical protein N0F65_012255 [Lagenidium giganteum]|uniref:Calmodulin n=1 Tax=Lagenidium giganteum TaxID=4803 RepID=A0AAV2ZD57_9STRA|nr:TPA: hypothetical protein N0F65_012255 [Lagenidium giganteum]